MGRKRKSIEKRLRVLRNTVRDRIGLPVTFTDAEANRKKQQLAPDAIAAARCDRLGALFGLPSETIAGFVAEAEALAIAQERDRVEQQLAQIDSPMSTDDSLSLYAVIRAAAPKLAIETGTAAGASALYILHAMERNGAGHLHSIDLVEDDPSIGVMIPADRRDAVDLHRGNSLELLPRIVAKTGPIDLFLHDSNHEYDHMMAEYEWALGAVKPGGVIASHDILHSNAWPHFLKKHGITRVAEIRNFGVCVAP